MKIVLHFDINKTTIVADAGSGRDFISSLNSLLSEAVWGHYPTEMSLESRGPDDWVPIFAHPGVLSPASSAVTFGNYLEDYTQLSKMERRRLKCAFTKQRFGEIFQPHLEALDEALRLPIEHPNYHLASKYDFFKCGSYHILPSFFNLLDSLVEQQTDFRIIFRTFGIDAAAIAEEYNLFCEGNHPFFRPTKLLDGTDPVYARDLRLHLPLSNCKFKRTSPDSDGLHLSYIDSENVSLFTIMI
jgi:hypothetical protein